MSRVSAAPGTSSSPMAHLTNCIASVDFACRTLEASSALLTEQTQDMARIAKILRSKRHFDLLSEQEIRTARNHLSAEIAPQLKELIVRAEDALQRDERKAKVLKGKITQQNVRLEQLAQLHEVTVEQLRTSAIGPSNEAEADEEARTEDDTDQRAKAEEVRRLREQSNALKAKRMAMQRELANAEREFNAMRKKGR